MKRHLRKAWFAFSVTIQIWATVKYPLSMLVFYVILVASFYILRWLYR